MQAGIEKLPNLRVLYMSNNKVRDWAEIERLAALEHLEELLLLNNPVQAEFVGSDAKSTAAEYRVEVRALRVWALHAVIWQNAGCLLGRWCLTERRCWWRQRQVDATAKGSWLRAGLEETAEAGEAGRVSSGSRGKGSSRKAAGSLDMMAGYHSKQTSLDKQHAKSAGELLKTAGLARSSSEFNLSAGAMGVCCRGAVLVA